MNFWDLSPINEMKDMKPFAYLSYVPLVNEEN